uniref:Translation initiation factor eIF2B subunit gamma n=1 Tax=Meloidogyne hapla TaxID=6305 RepID=A0A1I8BBH5_MELHA
MNISEDYVAVVFAGGKGNRMPSITEYIPKLFLPIINIPLFWFPLDLLKRNGFKVCILIVPKTKIDVINKILYDRSLPSLDGLKITTVSFDDDEEGSEEFGTADVLLQNLDKLNIHLKILHGVQTKHGVQLPAKAKQKLMEDALVEFCVTDARPFSLINGKGFISFLDAYSELIIDRHLKNQATTSNIILPNETTISRKVVDVLKSKQPELNAMFSEMSKSGFSISLDFSQKLGTDYCVMVAHYIKEDWYDFEFINDFWFY